MQPLRSLVRLCVILTSFHGECRANDEAMYVFEGVRSRLKGFECYQVEIKEVFQIRNEPQVESHYMIGRDAEKLRFDVTTNGRVRQFIRTESDTFERAGNKSGVIHDHATAESKTSAGKTFDPFVVCMMTPEEFHNRVDVDRLIDYWSGQIEGGESQVERKDEFYVLSFHTIDPLAEGHSLEIERRLFVNYARGFIPVKVEEVNRFRDAQGNLIKSQAACNVISKWSQDNTQPLPQRVVLDSAYSGYRYELSYTWNRGQPDGSIFTPAGLNVPPGTPMLNVRGEKPFVEADDLSATNIELRHARWQRSLLVCGGIIAALAAVVLYRQRRQSCGQAK